VSAHVANGTTWLFTGGRLLDPAAGTLAAEDLLVVDGVTTARGTAAHAHAAAARA